MASIPTYVREEDWAEEQTREFRRRTRNLVYGTELGEEPPVARGQAQPSGGASLASGQVPSTGSGQVLSQNTPIEDDVARFREATRALNFGGMERHGEPEQGGGLGPVPDPVESFRMFVSKLPPFSIAGAVEKGAGTETTQPSLQEIGEQMRARLQARVEQANPITGIERSLQALQRYGIEPTTELAYGPLLRGEVQLPQGPGDIGPFAGRLALHTGQRLGQGIDWLKLGEQWREETPEPAPGVKGVLEMLGPVGLIGPTEAESLAKGARALVKGAGPLTQRLATQAPEALADLSRAVKPLVPALSVEDVSKALPEGALTKFDTPEIIAERARQRDFAQTILDTSQERAALRQSIADQLYGTGAVKKEKRADIVLGPPAAGKSSVVTTPLAKEHGSLIIDADMAKELLPELEGGRGAGRVHQESAQIAEDLLFNQATGNGDNIVMPLVGKNANKIRTLRDILLAKGYEVHLHLVDLPAEKAAARAVERFEQTGRFVDPHYVLNIGDSPAKTYDIIKSEGGIASYERFSNDVLRGQAPILVERGSPQATASINRGGAPPGSSVRRGMAHGTNPLDQRGGQVPPLRRTGGRAGDQDVEALAGEGSTPEVSSSRPQSPLRHLIESEEGNLRLPTPRKTPTSSDPATQKLFDMYYGETKSVGRPASEKLRDFRDWFIRQATDRNISLSRFQQMAERAKGAKLTPDELLDQLIRLNPDKAAEVRIQEGLRPAIQMVGDDLPYLSAYLTHQNNIDVARSMGAKAARAAKALTVGAEVEANRAFSGGLRVADSERALAHMPTELGPERMQRVEQAAQSIYDWMDSMRQRLVDSGVWSKETAADFRARYPHYVPIKILEYMAEPQGLGVGRTLSLRDKGIRELTIEGTEKAREDPLASLVRLAYQTEAMARKNDVFNAFRKLRDYLAESDPTWANRIREVPAGYIAKKSGPDAEHIITGFVDGKKVTYAVPQELGLAYDYVGPEPWKPLRLMMSLFKMGATARNPLFLSGNAAIDAMTFLVRECSREGGPRALPRVARALGEAYMDAFRGLPTGEYKGLTAEFLKGGGGMFGFFQSKPEETAKAVAYLRQNNCIDIRTKDELVRAIRDLATLKPIEAVGERIELAPRVASYKLGKARYGNQVQAVVAGREVTIDFARGGEASKILNQFIPFFNVGMQAPAQIVRAFRENPRGFLGSVVGLLAAPTVAAEAWNRADPQRARDYDDVPQYVKDQGIVIMLPGEAPLDEQGNRRPQFILLRTREYTPFVTVTREIVRRAVGEEPRDWADLIGRGVLTSISPVQGTTASELASGILPPLVGTGVQLAADKDLYRNRVIATEYGDEQASAFSKAIAERLGVVRPSQVEFALRDIFTGVGGVGLAASDIWAGEQKGTATPQGAPVVGGLVGRFVKGSIGERLERAQEEALSDEARQLLKEHGVKIEVQPVGTTIRNIRLLREERERYQLLANRYVDAAIKAVAADSDWQELTAEEKERVISQVISRARQRAAGEVLESIPEREIERRLATAKR